MAKHPETNCDCGPKAASPLALRWRSAIMKISTLAAVCDGERIRKVEPQGDGDSLTQVGNAQEGVTGQIWSACPVILSFGETQTPPTALQPLAACFRRRRAHLAI